MLVVTPKQMQNAEKLGISKGANPDDYMEAAGKAIAEHLLAVDPNQIQATCLLLLGPGNNAGDALVAGRYLLHQGWNILAVEHYPKDKCSPLYQLNYDRFKKSGGNMIQHTELDWSHISSDAFIIDGLLGPSPSKPLEGPMLSTIETVNSLSNEVISIDIPSGLDGLTGRPYDIAVEATMTIAIGFAKIGCFLENAKHYVGMLITAGFGLDPSCIESIEPTMEWIDPYELVGTLPPLETTDHKYQRGTLSILASAKCLSGATSLASLAALRSGCGILFVLTEENSPLKDLPIEVVQHHYRNHDLDSVKPYIEKSSCLLVGPGFSDSELSANVLQSLFAYTESRQHLQLVIDASALTLIAKYEITPPKNAILTPHLGEMNRLLDRKDSTVTNELISAVQDYANSHRITIVLKSHNMFVFHPNVPCQVFSLTDPGMATAGTGDVLSGIISGIIAQGKNAYSNLLTGISLHCLSGLYAAESLNSYSMIASDLIDMLPLAINALEEES